MITINNKELANHLFAIAIICAKNDTDNCDIELITKSGTKLNCYIEFSNIERIKENEHKGKI